MRRLASEIYAVRVILFFDATDTQLFCLLHHFKKFVFFYIFLWFYFLPLPHMCLTDHSLSLVFF